MRTLFLTTAFLLIANLINAQATWNVNDTTHGAWYAPYIGHDNSNNIYAGIQNQSSTKRIKKISAGGQVLWEKPLPINDNYRIKKITTMPDGVNYLIADVFGSTVMHGLCARLDPSGSFTWTKQIDSFSVNDLLVRSDTLFVSGVTSQGVCRVLSFNGNGSQHLKTSTPPITGQNMESRIVFTADNQLMLVVAIEQGTDLLIGKLNPEDLIMGPFAMQQIEFQIKSSKPLIVKADKLGNAYIVCTADTFINGSTEAKTHLIKVNSAMAIVWKRTLVTSETNNGVFLAVDNNNEVIVSAHNAHPFLVFGGTSNLVKYNNAGILQWQKSHVDSVRSYSDILIRGNDVYVGSLSGRLLIEKLNAAGQVLDSVIDTEGFYPVIDMDEDGNLLAGSQYRTGDDMLPYGSYVAKYGLLLSVADKNKPATTAFALYPNPAQVNSSIFFSDAEAPKRVAVYDIEGRAILITNVPNGQRQLALPPQVVPGVYLVELKTAGQTTIQRLVVQQ